MSGRGRSADISHISLALIVVFTLNFFVIGCASTDRLPPVPLAMASQDQRDIPDARFYPTQMGSAWRPLASRPTNVH